MFELVPETDQMVDRFDRLEIQHEMKLKEVGWAATG